MLVVVMYIVFIYIFNRIYYGTSTRSRSPVCPCVKRERFELKGLIESYSSCCG